MGKIIAFEGIDGAGKSTQIKLLVERLKEEGIPCFAFKSPSLYVAGTTLRKYIENGMSLPPPAVELLFALDRVFITEWQIIPALEMGFHVLIDRWKHSAFAYGQALGFDSTWIADINYYVVNPDIVVYLDVDEKISLSRVKIRTRYEGEKLLQRVKRHYNELIEGGLHAKDFYLFDANKDKEKVREEIWGTISPLL